jgi:hypothetical protein
MVVFPVETYTPPHGILIYRLYPELRVLKLFLCKFLTQISEVVPHDFNIDWQ